MSSYKNGLKLFALMLTSGISYKIWDENRSIKYLGKANVNKVIHAFLDDRYCDKLRTKFKLDNKIIIHPDFTSKDENHRRYRQLLGCRRWMWGELPPDTNWYRYRIRFDSEFDKQIHLVWPSLDPGKRKPKNEKELLEDIILFTHGDGKYMIIEGNHRYTQWKENGMKSTRTEVYVAESTGNYCHYPGDNEQGYNEFDPKRIWY